MKNKIILVACIILLGTFLRFYQIDKIPYGLYIDEVGIGYNAYTILQSGQDEYGKKTPLFFQSFGDYKPPGYIYLTSASIALFGKNEFAVRFPSAFLGCMTLIVFYLLCNKLITLTKKISLRYKKYFPIIATGLLAISPWHIHFSRGGFEVNAAAFFLLTGSYFFILFWDKKKISFLWLGYLFFLFSLYTYPVYRIITPISFFLVTILFFFKLTSFRKQIIFSAIAFIVLSSPILQFSFTPEGQSRFIATSAFVEYPGNNLQEKLLIYPMAYIKNYFSFFSTNFLFNAGDGNGRHQIANMGLFYHWEVPFMFIGAFWLLKQKKSLITFVILAIIIIAPLGASIARPSPHTLRSLVLVVPLIALIALGIVVILEKIKDKGKVAVLSLLMAIAFYEFGLYIHTYYVHYPNVNALDWGAGYKEIVLKTTNYDKQYSHIVIDDNLNYAKAYFHFYGPELHPLYVGQTWKKPESWHGSVLYIRPYYGSTTDPNIIDQVYLPGPHKKIYAQFWRL